nr:ABC transporter ATP-binding protein [uncultured Noviherbaspirillum sp.]
MAQIELVDLAHAYRPMPSQPSDYALRPMTMQWEDGGAYALLGPSGCGKTTLLNIISGLVRPSQGRVLFDGRDVTGLPPEQRNIAQVFQFPVIYDTMTVFDNLAFPLRNRGWKPADVRRRVEQIAAMLELSSDLRHRASGLAVDAKQKISLGRGLVRPDVAAVLFDEPLTVIDPHLKWLLRRKLKEIHHELRLSLIYVTHDQVEALTFADKVVVMTEGEVVQSGTAQDLFEAPAHTFVGYFIGNPGMNLIPCTLQDGAAQIAGGSVALSAPAAAALRGQGRATLGIRPEYVEVAGAGEEGAIGASVISVRNLGTHCLAEFLVGGQTVAAKLQRMPGLAGERAWLRFPAARTLYYIDDKRVA